MSQEKVDLARQGFAAYNAGDLEALVDLLSPDVEIRSPPEYPNEGTFHGHPGFWEWLNRWLEAWDSFRVEARHFETVGDDVIASVRQYARGKSSGVEVEMDVAYLFTVEDGKITRFHIYPGRVEALEAVRLRK